MNKTINTVCAICGHKCKPRGLGAHMRLKHGIKVETVVKYISDSSGDSSEKVQRPSDWKNRKQQVIETRVKPNKTRSLFDQRPDLIGKHVDEYGRVACTGCGIKEQPGSLHAGGYCHFCHNGLPNPHLQNQIDWENGKR